MTKKDYIMIAKAIRMFSSLDNDSINKKLFVNALCGVLKEDNKLFNPKIFINACND
tara:strand:+ start:251 stop:418 length:168 start_codon:yes stop_codon:yes gene_type:complete